MGGNKDKKRKVADEEETMTTSTHAAATDKAEKKKSKKKKREASENGHHEEEEEAPAAAAEEEEEEEDEEAAAAAAAAEKKARKKAKKEAKRLAKLGDSAATNGDAAAAEEEEDAEEEEQVSKEEKKRRKKEKKRQEKEAGNGSSSTVPSTPSSSAASSSSSGIMSQTEAQAWWEKNEILVSGPGCELFLPTLTFAGANFPTDLLACTKGFTTPTPIQAQCWPVLMAGRDIIGIAETGSGKTLTFALPGLVHIRAKVKEGGGGGKGGRQQHVPRMLVVAPTRELAMQSAEVLDGVLSGLDLRSTCLFGGVNKHEQRQALRQGVDIVVATPGRLADLMEEGECDLSQVSYLVLDEADRMLDQGFEQAIRGIILECAPAEKRQTALFSATWPQSIQTLAREFLRDPVKVTIGGEDLSSNKRVKQVVEVLGEFDREKRLRVLLQQYHGKRDNRVLVFALYKKEAARLEQNLQRQGFNCLGIHGDKGQNDRIAAIEKFKTKEVPLLIATDVAARGLDIPDVEVVINYSFPLTIEDYVHRIGRTGRAGKTGIAHTFFHQGDKGNAGALVNTLNQAGQEVPADLMKFGTAVKKKEHKLYGAFGPKDGMEEKKATKIVFGDDD